jgi:SulP family sulfate permease
VVWRFEAPLIFASAEALEQRVDELVEYSEDPLRAVVLDLESVSDIDTDGADMLGAVSESLHERDIAFLIARLNRAGRDALERAEVYDEIGEECFFLSVRTAVRSVTGEQEDAIDRLMQRYQIED